jgi:hypothetical protein
MDSALTVVVIQRADTKTPMTTTKKKRKMAVVTGDELDPAPLLHRRPSATAAPAAVVAITAVPSLLGRRFEARGEPCCLVPGGEKNRVSLAAWWGFD